MRTDELNRECAAVAVEWFTLRMRKKFSDPSLVFPSDWMPENGLAVLDDEDNLLAVAALYIDRKSPVAVAGWCIANPENRAKVSYQAVSLLMKVLPIYAKKCGAKYFLTMYGNAAINSILDRQDCLYAEMAQTRIKIL